MSYADEVGTRLTPHENSVGALAVPLFEKEGAEEVFASLCCDRVFVGIDAPTKCSTCDRDPGYVRVCRCGQFPALKTADGVYACETCISYSD